MATQKVLADATSAMPTYAEGIVVFSTRTVSGRNGKKYVATEARIYIFKDYRNALERLAGKKVRMFIWEANDKRRRR
jgi:hypothetical protein